MSCDKKKRKQQMSCDEKKSKWQTSCDSKDWKWQVFATTRGGSGIQKEFSGKQKSIQWQLKQSPAANEKSLSSNNHCWMNEGRNKSSIWMSPATLQVAAFEQVAMSRRRGSGKQVAMIRRGSGKGFKTSRRGSGKWVAMKERRGSDSHDKRKKRKGQTSHDK